MRSRTAGPPPRGASGNAAWWTRHAASVVPASVFLAGAAVAAARTSGAVYEAPSYAILAVAAAGAAAALLVPERARGAAVLAATLAAGAAAGHVLARAGIPRIHDFDHLWGIWAYGRSIGAGSWYPLWIPYLGAGMPLLQFYGPLNFLLALPGILAGLAPVGALKLELFQGHVLSALSFLAAARLLGAGRRGALLAAIAGAFAPWRLAVFDYRGALGEANAFLFLPLVAAAALRTAREPRFRTAAILALSVVGLILTHLPSLFTLGVSLVPALVVQETWGARVDASRGKRFGGPAAALLAALLLSAWWWVPAAAEGGATSVGERSATSRYFRYEEHGVDLRAPLTRRLWDRYRISLPESYRAGAGAGEEPMPFYGGAVLLLAGLAAPLWARRSGTAGLALGALLALSLSTVPLAHALGGVPGFAQLYFPWRFLTPATVLAALALGLGAGRIAGAPGPRARALLFPMLAALLVWDAAPYAGAADRIPPYEGVVHWTSRERGAAHWESSMTPVPVAVPPGPGPFRTWDLKLPPSSYSTPVDALYYVYPEWVTPALYRTFWVTSDPKVLSRAGVSLMFDERRAEPLRLVPRPYAELQAAGGLPSAVSPDRIERRPGRIEAGVVSPPGGGRLVVLEQFFPGWLASVDGKGADPPADQGGFMAVDVPPGEHRVVLSYGIRTPARIIGLAATLFCLPVALAGGLIARRRKR